MLGITLRAGLMAAVLAACAAPAPLPPKSAGYRDVAKPIYSTASLRAARLVGQWRQVAGFDAGTCTGGIDFAGLGAGLGAHYSLCAAGGRVQGAGAVSGAGGAGRFALPGHAAPLWVLWIDEADQTLVLGTPDGSFGGVFAKGPLRADHDRAAREVLDWNGYDLARLKPMR